MRYFLVCLWSAALLWAGAAHVWAQPAASTFFDRLSNFLRHTSGVLENPGMSRMHWMRFYAPTVTVAERSGFLDRLFQSFVQTDKQRAVASYLYQMYISSGVYGGALPARLDVNYLGALNGLERLELNFDARKALDYYKKNKMQIKQWLAQFFKQAGLPVYAPEDPRNEMREIAFLKILAHSTLDDGRAGYVLSAPRWDSVLPESDQKWLVQVQQQAGADIRGKVVLYQEKAANLTALDKLSGQYADNGNIYLFRPASKECAACSYLTCAQVCSLLQAPVAQRWGIQQLYQVQMRSLRGNILKPAEGEHFRSPAGELYPDWFYHEAVLVIIKHGRQYIPVVLDPFLSARPMAFSQWLSLFDPAETILYAYPFQRWADTEERLVRPDKVKGNTIWKNGRSYKPYPVEY